MIFYRLCKKKYINDLSGKGAELTGGRWNSAGIQLFYTSSNRALCTSEIAVHTPLGIAPLKYYMISIEIPDSLIEEIELQDLHDNWKTSPPLPATKYIGDNFVARNTALVMKVPSAVVQGEYNYLINPNHALFNQVRIVNNEAFEFDKRLFEKE